MSEALDTSGEQLDITEPSLLTLREHRQAVGDIGLHLASSTSYDNIWYLYNTHKPRNVALLNQLYGVSTSAELAEASANAGRERQSDVGVWQELIGQARYGFDFSPEYRRVTGQYYLKGIEEMQRPAQLLGATLAVEAVFQFLPNGVHNREEALGRTAEICYLTKDELKQAIRVVAANPNPSYERTWISNPDHILMEACLNPEGITHQALSDVEGRIDLRYFADEHLIKRNQKQAFASAISGGEASNDTYAILRQEFPEQVDVLEADPDFLHSALVLMHNRALKHAADDRFPEYRSELLPPVEALRIIPVETVITVAEEALEEIRQYSTNRPSMPVVGSVAEAALLGYGAGSRVRSDERTQQGIARLSQSIEALRQQG